MDAKEYLEKEGESLTHHQLVRKIIYALIPLRVNRRATETYLNRYLYADKRFEVDIDAPLREGEVEPALAAAVRLEILIATEEDESFAFTREMILRNDHMYRTPDEYNNLLRDPPVVALTKELDTWQKMVSIINGFNEESHVLIKVKQLLDTLIGQHEDGENHRKTTDEEDEIPKERAFTISQSILCFHYVCQELGINYENSHKTDWARCIARITGRSEKRIRNSLNFVLDSKKTKRDITIIYPLMSKLIPNIGDKMLMDMK